MAVSRGPKFIAGVLIGLVVLGFLHHLFASPATPKQTEEARWASKTQDQQMAELSAIADTNARRTPDGLQPIPSGYVCQDDQLYRTLPGNNREHITDGSAAKYCRMEEICRMTHCAERASPSDLPPPGPPAKLDPLGH